MAKRDLKLNKEETPEVVETKKEPVFGVVVKCSKLRIRKTPSFNGAEVGTLDKGTKVEILDDKSAKFYKIEGGYCSKDFIEIE